MHLYFDFDGTIADTRPAIVNALQETFRRHKLRTPEASQIVKLMGLPLEKMFGLLAGYELPPEEFKIFLADYRALYAELSPRSIRLFAGMQAFLQKARHLAAGMAIVTSKQTAAVEKDLEALGIADLFDAVVGSDQVENYKPAPDTVLLAQKKMDGESARALVIGDSSFDILMGKAAGMKTCGVTWGAHGAEPLKEAQPDWLAEAPGQLLKIVQNYAAA